MSSPEKWEVRVGDRERQAMVDDLRAHFAEGRLTLDEYEDRAARAFAARTRADLVPLVSDLPALRTRPKGAPVRLPEPRSSNGRDVALRIHMGVWAVVVAFLVFIWLITTPGGYFWPIWVIAPAGLAVGIHAAVNRAVGS